MLQLKCSGMRSQRDEPRSVKGVYQVQSQRNSSSVLSRGFAGLVMVSGGSVGKTVAQRHEGDSLGHSHVNRGICTVATTYGVRSMWQVATTYRVRNMWQVSTFAMSIV